ncbi:Protein of unknown function [Arenibacter palladensis]|uniref:Glycerophosphoryl diester phosphodiesterase membrane domain-containing protein n=2 Tax=Arenibacter palladensis TaxID=237373 RepID=A0A1M4TG39_9FLAO|nr:Protein of unknown function [Arenibacter palladensis]
MAVIKEERKPEATITGSYGYGWQQMWKHFLYLFLVMIIVGIAESPASVVRDSDADNSAGMIILQILAAVYWLLVFSVVKYGGDLMYLRAIRNEKFEISEMFDGFKKNYINIILANLLTFAIIGLGFVLLIVPGIILACRLAFVSYLVMDKNMEPVAAVEKSWEMTKGHGWQIFGMGLLVIPIVIGGLICFIVGIVFSIIWISTAFASMYHAVDLEEKKQLNDEFVVEIKPTPPEGQ